MHRADFVFLEHTNRVVARKGITFGFRYRLTEVQTNSPLDVEMLVSYPPLTFGNGERAAQRRPLLVRFRPGDVTRAHFAGFTFDQEFEMVPGEWTVALRYKGRDILNKKFNVVKE